MLAGSAGYPVVVQAVGNGGRVHHQLGVPNGREGIVIRQLRALLPGLGIEKVEVPTGTGSGTFDVALAVRLSSRSRAVHSDDLASSSKTLLHALSDVGHDEYVVLQWVLGLHLGPAAVPPGQTISADSWAAATLRLILGTTRPLDSEQRRALADKRGVPGWRAIGRLAVKAASDPRRSQVLRQVLGALRVLEAPDVRVFARRTSLRKVGKPEASIRFPLRLNIREIAALSAWPVGPTAELPVDAIRNRTVPPSRAIPRVGRVVAESTFPGHVRPLALSASSSLRNLHVLGPIGTGKSTVLLNLIEQDLSDGRGLVVVEPKGDLIRDVLARVPDDRLDDVVVLDPTDPTGQVVGLNPLAPMGRPPELVADQLLGVFHSVYEAHWGPRTADILGNALATLARLPGMALPALPVLLTDAGFRRRVVSRLNDPIGLEPFWAAYDSWSDAERTAAIAPTLNKLRPLLVNPMIRAVLGQTEPKFAPRQVFTHRRVLLVNLAKGLLGPEASRALGSLVLNLMWQATLGRSAIAPEHRHPCFFFVDEFQDYVALGTDLGDALSQARGLGVGFTLSHQFLHQLDPAMRSAVLANARNRLCFALSPEDARVLASVGAGPAVEDFTSLGAFECYVQLLAGDAVQPWCSGRTLPASNPKRDPEIVQARSRDRYGIPRREVDQAIENLIVGGKRAADDDLTPRRRRSGGPQ
jgi:hypothetical protein